MTSSFKITAATVIALTLLLVLLFGFNALCWKGTTLAYGSASCAPSQPTLLGADVGNATYSIDGSPVTLVNGVSITDAAPGSASKITTRYFGNEVDADLNGDGRPDAAFILTEDTGGSGTFYYAVAALNTASGYVGSQGVLLGDRIAPQATVMGTSTTIIFNYADRNPGESFATPPSVGKSVALKLNPATMQLAPVALGQ